MGWFSKSDEEKAVKEIKELRKKIKDITHYGEGAIDLQKDELKNYRDKIKELKEKYPKDKEVQEAKLRSSSDKKFQGYTDNRNSRSIG